MLLLWLNKLVTADYFSFSNCTLYLNLQVVLLFQTTPEVKTDGSTHPSFLHTLSDHHNVVDVLLPDHLPEIIFRSWQRTLSGDVLPTEVITLRTQSKHWTVTWHVHISCVFLVKLKTTSWRGNLKPSNTQVMFSVEVMMVYGSCRTCDVLRGCNWRWCSRSRGHHLHRKASPSSSRLYTQTTETQTQKHLSHSSLHTLVSVQVCASPTGQDVVVSVLPTVLRQQSWVQRLIPSNFLQVLMEETNTPWSNMPPNAVSTNPPTCNITFSLRCKVQTDVLHRLRLWFKSHSGLKFKYNI